MSNTHNLETGTYSQLSFEDFRRQVLEDYRIAYESRQASIIARREVLTGKAKFGIFGDGKEVAQVAMSKFFRNGDYRSGYYRDQTFAFASGMATIEQYFSQLYADTNPEHEPFSSGRNMNAHFATPNVTKDGEWVDLVNQKNTFADIAPTAAQMPRSLGLAFTSRLFRNVEVLQQFKSLSDNGNEVCFCTIGDASTSEGHFWEVMNAAAVLQVPLAAFIWDDGYGISVPKKYQTVKKSISAALEGFRETPDSKGIDIYHIKGWDYAGLCEVFESGINKVREKQVPAIFHVEEMTQPQGHSSSGSHERYKSKERLAWEKEWDCNTQMRNWLLENALASEEELQALEKEAHTKVTKAKNSTWEKYITPIRSEVAEVIKLGNAMMKEGRVKQEYLKKSLLELRSIKEPLRKDILTTTANIIFQHRGVKNRALEALKRYYRQLKKEGEKAYNTSLYTEGAHSVLAVDEVKLEYADDAPMINGYEILNKYFDQLIANDPRVFAFGEDVGKIGDVNQAFAGLQQKYSEQRVFDTGIRELSIVGKAIGMAFRGLRPIAEIQYFDYILYGLEPLSDDVATLHYRTAGIQACPLIIRTRGHRLEGIFHSGSPMGIVINALRGFNICMPRDMTRAAGMYNTALRSNDPALIIECLNGYRLKEKLPSNLKDFTVPFGIPEVLIDGEDITIVSYGSILRIAREAIATLKELGISCELIDVQTLLPFDIHHKILDSLKKTNRIIFLDEDMPGAASAFMYRHVMEVQDGYRWLDVKPRTLTGKEHRPAYGTDGDYFSKPNEEDIVEMVLEMMQE